MRYAALLLALAACEPDGPHWHHECQQRETRWYWQPLFNGKTTTMHYQPRSVCVRWDSTWVDPTAVPQP